MLAWLSANLVNIALILVIALVVVLLIRGMIRDKKAGKSSCGARAAGPSRPPDRVYYLPLRPEAVSSRGFRAIFCCAGRSGLVKLRYFPSSRRDDHWSSVCWAQYGVHGRAMLVPTEQKQTVYGIQKKELGHGRHHPYPLAAGDDHPGK